MIADISRSVQAVSQFTGLSYLITVAPSSDYYDAWTIRLQPMRAREVHGRWNSISLPPHLNHAAKEGAWYGIVSAEMYALASGSGSLSDLSGLINQVYNPDNRLQPPKPVFEEAKDIFRIRMSAHYRDGPIEVATINRDVDPEELRQQVFNRMGELHGFRITEGHREK